MGKLYNRVKMTVSGTPGTGVVTLGTAIAGFQSFAGAGVQNGDVVSYVLESGSDWEIGLGTYTASGTTLIRSSITASSNSGSAISATSSAVVMISPLAADFTKIVPVQEGKTAPAISSGTLTLDCSAGNVFAVSLNATVTTLSFTNVPPSGTAYGLTLAVTADGTQRAIAWGGAVKWPGGSAPTPTSTNTKVDVFVLTTWDGGTTWYAFTAGQNL